MRIAIAVTVVVTTMTTTTTTTIIIYLVFQIFLGEHPKNGGYHSTQHSYAAQIPSSDCSEKQLRQNYHTP